MWLQNKTLLTKPLTDPGIAPLPFESEGAAQQSDSNSDKRWSMQEIEDWVRRTLRVANQTAMEELDKKKIKDK